MPPSCSWPGVFCTCDFVIMRYYYIRTYSPPTALRRMRGSYVHRSGLVRVHARTSASDGVPASVEAVVCRQRERRDGGQPSPHHGLHGSY